MEEKFSTFENKSQERFFKNSSTILPVNDYSKFESRLHNVEETLKNIQKVIPAMNGKSWPY